MGDMIDREAALAIEGQLAKSMAHFLRVEQWQAYKAGVQGYRDAVAALEPVTPAPDAAMRLETVSENIARDMREGRFPVRSDPQMVPVTPAPDAAIREAALREAADYIEHAPVGTRFQDRDAILALIQKEKPHDHA